MLLTEGRVKIASISEDGREAVLAFRGPGEVLGELSAIDGQPRSAGVIAVDPVERARHPDRRLPRVPGALAAAPSLWILTRLIARLREADRKRAEFGASDTIGRVAARLVELAADYGRPQPGGGVLIDLPITQEELASWVGSSREGVNKALHTLRGLHWVETERRAITVLDMDALRKRAGCAGAQGAARPARWSGYFPAKYAALRCANSAHSSGQLVLGEAGVDRAGLDARVAVDALLGIDVEHLDLVVVGLVRRRVDAVDRADLDARVVLGADAGLCDHVGHGLDPRSSTAGSESGILGSAAVLLLTGATGRVGAALLPRLTRARVKRCAAWSATRARLGPARVRVQIALGDLADPASFRHALRGVRTVVHLAGARGATSPRRASRSSTAWPTWRLAARCRARGRRALRLFLTPLGAVPAAPAPRVHRAKALAEEAVAGAAMATATFAGLR